MNTEKEGRAINTADGQPNEQEDRNVAVGYVNGKNGANGQQKQ